MQLTLRQAHCPSRFFVMPAHLGLDEGVSHDGDDLQQHGRHVVVGLLACGCGGVTQEHAIRTPADITLGDQLQQRQPADVDLVQDVLPEVRQAVQQGLLVVGQRSVCGLAVLRLQQAVKAGSQACTEGVLPAKPCLIRLAAVVCNRLDLHRQGLCWHICHQLHEVASVLQVV